MKDDDDIPKNVSIFFLLYAKLGLIWLCGYTVHKYIEWFI